ncbi:type II toxin-antitoxin system VapC family toxin [Dolichospermum sp. ST_sed1]|nr:type II toxin-antitoxin system VapC family toxin [Dolichospermum sp. ST_sed1]MDD1424020.1 type II toxin-antitoxin system VapC family toxin [Dolichospermum sp. ST_sed9]MDD1430456.1 type II toxin-antitoxin system VapC family toxin [Dolichospermum sp. ST_sed6]MDD1439812.1 type II toxin-antitoxin system VapC family toxin [Dolichospermum sp. ST_sed3]MDD1446767.1 type II toxin-antitoxin system VapC family toxin [Dolichospermum sp. ST_sed8]MDD1454954.1 type II toxin-antitoxin system VapC family to
MVYVQKSNSNPIEKDLAELIEYIENLKENNLEKTLARQQNFLKLFISLPFDDDASLIYGRIRAELSSKGIMIGSNDLQIAAIAMANNLILVTHNVKEFSRVNGLQFEDWEV